jgi:hypothetical protein
MPLKSREEYDRARRQLSNEAFRSSYPQAAVELQKLIDEYEKTPAYRAPQIQVGDRPPPPSEMAAVAAQLGPETPDLDMSPDVTNAPRTPRETADAVAEKATALARGLTRGYAPGFIAPGDRITAAMLGEAEAEENRKAEAANPGYSLAGNLAGGFAPGSAGQRLFGEVNRHALGALSPLGAAAPIADKAIAGAGAGATTGLYHGLSAWQENPTPSAAAGIGAGTALGAALGASGPAMEVALKQVPNTLGLGSWFRLSSLGGPSAAKAPLRPRGRFADPEQIAQKGADVARLEPPKDAAAVYSRQSSNAAASTAPEATEAYRQYLQNANEINAILENGKAAAKALPAETRGELVAQARKLQSALLSAPDAARYRGPVYAARRLTEKETAALTPGASIRSKGIWNASARPDVAAGEAAAGNRVVFRIDQEIGVPIGFADGAAHAEQTVLLPAGRHFQVVGRSTLDDGTEVVDLWQF